MAHAELDLVLRSIVLMLLTVLVMSLFLKKLNQPYFVAYIIAGFYWALKAFNDHETIVVMGELGLIIQMFFIGAEIEVPQLIKNIRKLLTGVLVQLLLSFVFMLVLGLNLSGYFSWLYSFNRSACRSIFAFYGIMLA
jgi:CPA2 family monovalent cation:H+ antiporter-2